jgi:hypothetical protein
MRKQRAKIVKAPRSVQSVIGHALRDKLTWTHYYLLLRVKNPDARAFSERGAFRIDLEAAVVRYTLAGGQQQILAARYQLYLPTEEELAAELRREQARFARRRLLEGDVTK